MCIKLYNLSGVLVDLVRWFSADDEEDEIFQFEDGQDGLSTEPIPSIPELAEHFV